MNSRTLSLTICTALCAVMLTPTIAQQFSAQAQTQTPVSGASDAQRIAAWMRTQPYVVDGEFLIENLKLPADFYKKRQKLLVEFKPNAVLKGAPVPAVMHVQVNSDLLAVPGENISAGAKRDHAWAEIDNRRAKNERDAKELEARRSQGQIADPEYSAARGEIEKESLARTKLSSALSTSPGVTRAVHGETIQDAGGMISRGVQYLITFDAPRNIDGENVYVLPATTSSVIWGSRREQVLKSLAP